MGKRLSSGWLVAVVLSLGGAGPAMAQDGKLGCGFSSAEHTFDDVVWTVQACNDGKSILLTKAPKDLDSAVILVWSETDRSYQVMGSDEAMMRKFAALTSAEVATLYAEAVSSKQHVRRSRE